MERNTSIAMFPRTHLRTAAKTWKLLGNCKAEPKDWQRLTTLNVHWGFKWRFLANSCLESVANPPVESFLDTSVPFRPSLLVAMVADVSFIQKGSDLCPKMDNVSLSVLRSLRARHFPTVDSSLDLLFQQSLCNTNPYNEPSEAPSITVLFLSVNATRSWDILDYL